jgi:citrate synthase
MTENTAQEIRKGLAGVIADSTAISKVNPETNSLLYRGYPVQELAAQCTFEEVAYLLWHGELPTPVQLEEFQALERAQRHLDPRHQAHHRRTAGDGASDGCRAHRSERHRRAGRHGARDGVGGGC